MINLSEKDGFVLLAFIVLLFLQVEFAGNRIDMFEGDLELLGQRFILGYL
jgi:hypothetical protein